jgi:hypothetical protein
MSSIDPAQGSVVGEESTEAPPESVIPQGNVVILREADLDTDLATAIEHVRSQPDTRNSRILIIGPEQPTSHEPAGAVSLPVPDMPTSVLQVARAGGEQTLTGFASTYRPLLQSVERFFQEAGWVLDEIEEAGEEGVRARLMSRVRVARDIMSWIQCVLDDMNDELSDAASGLVPVDLQTLMQEAQAQVESFFPGVRVSVSAADQEMKCTGRPTALAEACFLTLVLTAHRIGGEGAITVEPGSEDGRLTYRILGLGEPAPVDAAEAMARLRELVVEQHGGSIQPDAMGPFGTGLLLALPR